MFKQIRHVLCLSLLSISGAFASGIQDVLNEPMFVNDEPLSFLWDVSYQGENVGALLGTYHIGKVGTVLPEKVKEYLAKSDQLITENVIAFQSQSDLAAQSLMFQSFFTSELTIDERFSPNTAKLWKSYLSSKGIPKAQQDSATDIFLYMLISIDIGANYGPQYGMEHLIGQYVILNKKPSEFKNIGLEQLLESIKYLQDAISDNLLEALELHFAYSEVMNGHGRAMFTCYQRNDVRCLFNEMLIAEKVIPMTEEEKIEAEVIMRKINEARNYNWMPKLVPILKDKKSGNNLIAVGSLHLFGKEGLIELLRKEGFELTPVLY